MSLMTWLSSEGRCHYNTEEVDCSNPIPPPDYMAIPPTFVPYTARPFAEVEEDKVRVALSRLLEEKSERYIANIQKLVEEKLQANIALSIEEAIRQAFSELGIITNEEIDDIVENT